MRSYSASESGAFVEQFEIAATNQGPLNGLSFAVKDLFDVAGRVTGCGNPSWRATHPPAAMNAVVVDLLLAAGARCVGKTVTDQLAFSLIGANYFDGTPLNPRAPDRVPGGSSSGSGSAVACGLADFALGTDTGGSVRFPASNCGIVGIRTSHGSVSVAGVMPFAPTFDTVGVLARDADTLARASSVLIGRDIASSGRPDRLLLVAEAFELVDPAVRGALEPAVGRVERLFGERVREISVREIDQDSEARGLERWYETYCQLQFAEIWSCLGGWIEATKPDLGPIAASFALARSVDRSQLPIFLARREAYCERLSAYLGPGDLLCMPTVPAPAPKKDAPIARDASYYQRSLSLTAMAGVGRLPQVTLPAGSVEGAPVGLSLLARHRADPFLLAAASELIGLLTSVA